MTAPGIVFAIPGDIDTLTGGYIYEKAVLEGLQRSTTSSLRVRGRSQKLKLMRMTGEAALAGSRGPYCARSRADPRGS